MVLSNLMPIAIKSDKIVLSSEKKTEQLAEKFVKKLKLGDVVFLYGEIGVGKTTFIRHLINCYQTNYKLKLTEVPSPTFNLLNEYEIKQIIIKHYDLFRLKNKGEIKNLGLFDNNFDTITLIEWPQLIKEKPKNLIELFFKYEDNHQQRSIELQGIKL